MARHTGSTGRVMRGVPLRARSVPPPRVSAALLPPRPAADTRFVTSFMRNLAGALLLFAALPELRAADEPTTADESRRLRQEIERAQQQILQLQDENARLRGIQATAVPVVAPPASTATLPPAGGSSSVAVASGAGATPVSVTVVTMPPLAEGETVTVDQLLADYRQSTLAADSRYKGRRFLVRGTVGQIEKVFVVLQFDVTLRGQDPLARARTRMTFPGISDVRLTPDQRELYGRKPFKAERLLLRLGEEILFEGECEGLDNGVLHFRKAQPVSP